MNYADSSFVVSLFVPDINHEAALATTAGENLLLVLTPLLRLEDRNALNRGVQQKRMTLAQRDAVWLGFTQMITAGSFVEMSLPAADLHAKARELSDRYTPTLGRKRRGYFAAPRSRSTFSKTTHTLSATRSWPAAVGWMRSGWFSSVTPPTPARR